MNQTSVVSKLSASNINKKCSYGVFSRNNNFLSNETRLSKYFKTIYKLCIYVVITEGTKCCGCFYILQIFSKKIFVFECICCFDVLPGQCFCWVSRPHIQNESALLWSTKGICEGQEKHKYNFSFYSHRQKNIVL